MKRNRVMGVSAIAALAASVAAVGTAAAEQFQITVENLSPNVLSPVFLAAHDGTFDIFDEGAPAPLAIELVAEEGDASELQAMAMANLGGSVSAYGLASNGGPIMQNESATIMLDTDMSHPWLSFASMLGISNDGFIGQAAGDDPINLFPGGVPFRGEFIVVPDDVWDAGTEVNTELAEHVGALGGMRGAGIDENGVIFKPHAGILGIGDIPIERDWTGGDVARITITPEPASLLLVGLAGAFVLRRRGA